MKRNLWIVLATLAIGLPSASAGIITGVTTFGSEDGTGPGMGSVTVVVFPALNPNNNNQDGTTPLLDNNIDVPIKRFDAVGYIDIEFLVTPSGGTSEYLFIESIDNNTGVLWSGYTMQLGFGTGAGFTPSTAGDFLDFDAPLFDPAPTSAAFPVWIAPNEDLLVFSGGTHGSGQQVYRIRIDVPDDILPGDPLTTFTLRQTPVPEPGALGLAGVAIVGLLIRRRFSYYEEHGRSQ